MDVCAVVPVKKFDQSKSRLSPLLQNDERIELSRTLLQDILNTLLLCRELTKIVVVTSDPSAKEITENLGLECLIQPKDNGVNSAIRCADRYLYQANIGTSITIPCDLPLLLRQDIDYVCHYIPGRSASVIICPSYKFDGTNLLVRNPFNIFSDTRYDCSSFRGHLEASIKAGAYTRVLLCSRLMIDLDTPEDLSLVLSSNTSPNKSISYLRKIRKNSSSLTSAAAAPQWHTIDRISTSSTDQHLSRMNPNPTLLLNCLRAINEGPITLDLFMELAGIKSVTILNEILGCLLERGIGKRFGDALLSFTSTDRLKASILAIGLGGDVMKISQYLSWKDFERLASEILVNCGYQTLNNVRFVRPRAEIDIVAVKSKLALSIDCKHWAKNGSFELVRHAQKQIQRTKRLFSSPIEFRTVVPVLLTIYPNHQPQNSNVVPIVDISKFRRFVDEIEIHLDKVLCMSRD